MVQCPSFFNISSHESSFLLEYNASAYVRVHKVYSGIRFKSGRDSDRGRRGKGDVLGQEVEYVDADNWTAEEIYDPARTGSHESPVRNVEKRERERLFRVVFESRSYPLSTYFRENTAFY